MVFPVAMYRCENWTKKEAWALKNWCFQILVLEKTLENPFNCKEIEAVNPKGNQSWIFIGRTDAEAEAPRLWSPDEKNWFIGKDPDSGKDWGQEEKGMTEDEMVRWHHQFNGHELGQAPGDSEGQESLACCSPWDYIVGQDWVTKLTEYIVVVVQLQCCVQFFATPWAVAHQASLSLTISRSLPKFMSIELLMLSNHLLLFHPLFLLPSVFSRISLFPMNGLFTSGGQSIGASASVNMLPLSVQSWFPLELTSLISLLAKVISTVFSYTTIQNHQFFSTQHSLWSNSHICTWLLEKP